MLPTQQLTDANCAVRQCHQAILLFIQPSAEFGFAQPLPFNYNTHTETRVFHWTDSFPHPPDLNLENCRQPLPLSPSLSQVPLLQGIRMLRALVSLKAAQVTCCNGKGSHRGDCPAKGTACHNQGKRSNYSRVCRSAPADLHHIVTSKGKQLLFRLNHQKKRTSRFAQGIPHKQLLSSRTVCHVTTFSYWDGRLKFSLRQVHL